MGIKCLHRYLVNNNIPTTHPYIKYRSKIFAIDVNILVYKLGFMYPHSIGSFLECFVYKITALLKFGIFPVFIFDGQAPVEKQQAILRRLTCKKHLRDRLETLKAIEPKTRSIKQHIHRLERQCFFVTKAHRYALMKLIDGMKLLYITSNGEAESLCALLQRSGNVDYTFSEDTDTLAYGCTNTVHAFKNSDRYFVETDLNLFLKSKNLTHDEFLNICVLSGCDYLDRASNVHIETCVEYVHKYHTLDATLRELRKRTVMHDLKQYERVKKIYLFESEGTACVLQQHEQCCRDISTCLVSLETHGGRVIDTSCHDALSTLFTTHGLATCTADRLIQIIKNSLNEFSLVRHNFFSKQTNNIILCK